MILQDSYVTKQEGGKTWKVFSNQKKVVFELDGNLTTDQVSNSMRLAKSVELEAYLEGMAEVKNRNENEVKNYQQQIKELTVRNNSLAIKLQKYL